MRRLALPVLAVVVITVALLGRFWSGSPSVVMRGSGPTPAAAPSTAEPVSTPPSAGSGARSPGSLRIVVMSEEMPLEKVLIQVMPEGMPDQARTFSTRKDGTQDIQEIPEGLYALFVRHPGFGPAEMRATILAAQRTDVVVRLIRGGEIFGTVSDERGAPIEGAQVALLDSKTQKPVRPSLPERTDANGRYSLPGVPPGEYVQNFSRAGYRFLRKQGIRVHDVADRLQVDAVLVRGSSVSGRIVNEESRPIPGARVLAVNADRETAMTTSGSDGRFLLQGMGDQPMTLRAEATGYGITFRNGVAPNATDLEIRLPRAASISGRVEVSPLPDAFALRLWKFEPEFGKELGQQYFAQFTEKGEFTVPNISPGSYRLEIEAPGFETLDQPSFTLQSGGELSHVIIRMRRKP